MWFPQFISPTSTYWTPFSFEMKNSLTMCHFIFVLIFFPPWSNYISSSRTEIPIPTKSHLASSLHQEHKTCSEVLHLEFLFQRKKKETLKHSVFFCFIASTLLCCSVNIVKVSGIFSPGDIDLFKPTCEWKIPDLELITRTRKLLKRIRKIFEIFNELF